MRQMQDFFLKHGELPKKFRLSWAIFNDRLEILRVSEALYSQIKKPIAAIVKQPMISTFPNMDLNLIDLHNRETEQLVHFIDTHGHALQASIAAIDGTDDQWCIVFTQLSLDEEWLMELHPDYNLAIPKPFSTILVDSAVPAGNWTSLYPKIVLILMLSPRIA